MSTCNMSTCSRTSYLPSESHLTASRLVHRCVPAARLGNILNAVCSAEERKDLAGVHLSPGPRQCRTKRTVSNVLRANIYHPAAGYTPPLTRTSAYSTVGVSAPAPACPWPREQDSVFTATNFGGASRKRSKGPVSWLQGIFGEVSITL